MDNGVAERFIQALAEAEETRRIDALVALFDEDAEAANLARTEPARGRDGVAEFWRQYLHAFQEIRSEFTNVLEDPNGVVLEWISRGRLANGEPVEYRGVSVLETEGDRIRRFRTYYDSAVFMPLGAKGGRPGA